MEIVNINKLIRTLNPVSGCTLGCSYCYARKINQRFKITPDFSVPQFMEDRVKRIGTKKPNNYLMTSMSDLSDWKPEWRKRVFDKMRENPQHRYLFLTKRPERMQFHSDLDTFWMGVTVTSKADVKKIDDMREHVGAKNYFITFEPLFGDVGEINLDKVGWIVIGTETGNRKGKVPAEKEWILNIVRQAEKKHIPVFMKDTLLNIVGGENMSQELPEGFIR